MRDKLMHRRCGALNTDCGIETRIALVVFLHAYRCGALNTDCGIETTSYRCHYHATKAVAEP